ncbi:hypothetical protein D3C72_2392880 [compost metagenome]
MLHSHLGQQHARPRLGLCARLPAHLDGRDHQVLQHAQVREQVVLLEYEADALAQPDEFGFGLQAVHAHAVHLDRATLRP